MSEPNYALEPPKTGREMPAPALAYQAREPKTYRPGIGLVGCGGISASPLAAYRDAGYDVPLLCDRHDDRAPAKTSRVFPSADIVTDYRARSRADVAVIDLTRILKIGCQCSRPPCWPANMSLARSRLSLMPTDDAWCVWRQRVWPPSRQPKRSFRATPGLHARGRSLRNDWLPVAIRIGMQWDHNWIKDLPFDRIHHILLYDFAIHWFDFVASVVCRPGEGLFGFLGVRVDSPIADAACHAAALRPGGARLWRAGQASLTFDATTRHDPQDTTVIVARRARSAAAARRFPINKSRCTPLTGGSRHRLSAVGSPAASRAMAELLSAIEEHREPLHNAADNLTSLALCFAAVRSANTSQPVRLANVRSTGSSDVVARSLSPLRSQRSANSRIG